MRPGECCGWTSLIYITYIQGHSCSTYSSVVPSGPGSEVEGSCPAVSAMLRATGLLSLLDSSSLLAEAAGCGMPTRVVSDAANLRFTCTYRQPKSGARIG